MKRRNQRTILILLALLMVMGMLMGCKSALTLAKNQPPMTAPTVKGKGYAQVLNEQLAEVYAPLMRTVGALNARGFSFQLEYTLATANKQTVLETQLVGPGGEGATPLLTAMNRARVALPALTIDQEGRLFNAEAWQADMLADVDYWQNLLLLSAFNVNLRPEDYRYTLITRDLAFHAVTLYEGMTGTTIPLDGLVAGVDELSGKAYATGFAQYYDDGMSLTVDQVYYAQLFTHLPDYARKLYDALHHDSARVATVGDFLDGLLAYTGPIAWWDGAKVEALTAWQEKRQEPMTRLMAAKLMVDLKATFEAQLVTKKSTHKVTLRDTKNSAVKTATSFGLMTPYVGEHTFEPNRTVRLYEVGGLCAQFALNMMELGFKDAVRDDEVVIDVRQAVAMLGGVARITLSAQDSGQPVTKVDNSPGYDIYRNQNTTGKYSHVNCMPTVTYMCLKWQDQAFEVDPGDIRKEVHPKSTDGWTLDMAAEAIDHYKGRYKTIELGSLKVEPYIQALIDQLDQGRVLFCMMHEWDTDVSGHCMLIYGYEKSGDNVWFYAHDPDMGEGKTAFGQPVGQARRLEAHYAQWIIDRWTYSVIAMLPKD